MSDLMPEGLNEIQTLVHELLEKVSALPLEEKKNALAGIVGTASVRALALESYELPAKVFARFGIHPEEYSGEVLYVLGVCAIATYAKSVK